MPKKSAGILLFRRTKGETEFLLAHPGGPFFAKKDAGVWSIPKGEFTDEEAITAAAREFQEEVGSPPPTGEYVALTPVELPSKKVIFAWAVEGDVDESTFTSNLFEMEWPPHSGKQQSFPEIDQIGWFTLETAREKLSNGQFALIQELVDILQR